LQKIFDTNEKSNPRGKYGFHKYAQEDFGIDRDFIDKFKKPYQMFQKKLNPVQIKD
jgi:uncharacterized protein (DUF4415 family)